MGEIKYTFLKTVCTVPSFETLQSADAAVTGIILKCCMPCLCLERSH